MYVKYVSYFLLLCATSTTYAVDSPTIVGRIEDFDGNHKSFKLDEDCSSKIVPAAYTLIRGQKKVDIAFLTELQANDILVVNDDQHYLQIKLADNSSVKVTAAQSPYIVPAQGKIPSIFDNFKIWVGGLMTRHQEEVQAVSVSVRGSDGNKPPYMPLLEGESQVLVAGKRALFLTWKKGKPDYKITLKQGENTVFEQMVKNSNFQLPELELTPGPYRLLLSDAEQRPVDHAFTVVEKLPPYPPELTDERLASLSEPARLTVRTLWLAEQDNGKWMFEAYQHIAKVAPTFHFARVLRDKLETGEK